jgi:hypothetical protein
VRLYCNQFSIWLPPPDRAFSAYQSQELVLLVCFFMSSYSSMSWNPTALHFLFVYHANPFGFWIFHVVVSGCGHHGESVNIKPLTTVVGSFCIAPMMASWSMLNIDDWSLILLHVDCWSVTTAYPTFSSFFEPSV